MGKMNIPELIRSIRALYRETQGEFGSRFGVSGAAVSLWESGKREAPYRALVFVLELDRKYPKHQLCSRCNGTGIHKVFEEGVAPQTTPNLEENTND